MRDTHGDLSCNLTLITLMLMRDVLGVDFHAVVIIIKIYDV